MAPSPESRKLGELFKWISANFPTDGNQELERLCYGRVREAGTEASGVSISDLVSSAAGLKVPGKWFTPEGTNSSKHVVLFCHGGGFSFGSCDSHRKLTAHLAKACGCPALSVDYRLAPENKYPAALDDCVAGYQHLLDQGYDAAKIIVAGDSVGGCLSAAVPLAAMRRGLPVMGASVALSPLYDQSTVEGGTMVSNKDKDFINTAEFVTLLGDRYLGGTGASRTDSTVSPLFASDDELKRMPPTWISIAGDDMLRDHGERMAAKLKKAGVDVVSVVQEGQQHVMEFMVGRAPEADESISDIATWVKSKVS